MTLAVFGSVLGAASALRHHDRAFNQSNLWVAAVVIALVVAPGAGGYVAGTSRPRTAMTHGAWAAGLAFTATAVIAVIRAAVRGGVAWGGLVTSLVLFGVLFSSVGMIGGFIAFRRSVRSGPPGA